MAFGELSIKSRVVGD